MIGPLTECAWCSHPLDDASPSGEFCKERCAYDWRAGLDRGLDHRCTCATCDPERHVPVRTRLYAGVGALRDLSHDLPPASPWIGPAVWAGTAEEAS